MGKVIREDGGSSCNGLRRQASRLMEPCSSRKALSIRAARASMLSGCVIPNPPQHPAVISARAGARDGRASPDLEYFGLEIARVLCSYSSYGKKIDKIKYYTERLVNNV